MTDIFAAVRPTLYASAVFGLAPFEIDDAGKSVKVSRRATLYSVVLCALFAVNSGYAMVLRIGDPGHSFIQIGEYTYIVLFATGIVVGLCISVMALVQRCKISATVQNFHSVDVQMSRIDVRAPYERGRLYSTLAAVVLAALLVALLVHDYLVTPVVLGPIFWISYFAPIVLSTIMHYQFILGGLLLKKDFASLNERLVRFGTEETEVSGKKIHFVGSDGLLESDLMGKPIAAWDGNLSRSRARKVAPGDGLITPPLNSLAKIKIIRKVHSNLCEVKELLNSSYSLQILSTVAQAFIIITTNLYVLFTGGSSKDTTPKSYAIMWATFRAAELICITVTCTRISKTANHTAVIVHKLLSQEWDSTIRNQLKLFSIQLLHRKISFSACGFFTLDMTLLHAIIGAATTYLVILIQFHNTYES